MEESLAQARERQREQNWRDGYRTVPRVPSPSESSPISSTTSAEKGTPRVRGTAMVGPDFRLLAGEANLACLARLGLGWSGRLSDRLRTARHERVWRLPETPATALTSGRPPGPSAIRVQPALEQQHQPKPLDSHQPPGALSFRRGLLQHYRAIESCSELFRVVYLPGSVLNRLDDEVVAGTAAQVPGDGVTDIVFARVGVRRQ